MKNILIDLETLGRNSGCVILSIGAVEFDLSTNKLEDLQSSEGFADISNIIKDTFYSSIKVLPQLLEGAVIEKPTLDWWKSQSPEAKKVLSSGNSISIEEALIKLKTFILKECENVNDVVIWAQGTDFDISMLRAAYTKYFGPDSIPWCHTNIRDSRTFIYTMNNIINPKNNDPYSIIPEFKSGIVHNAEFDAIRTAYNVVYINNSVKLFLNK